MKIIDSHCHLTDSQFDADRDFIIKDLKNFNIKAVINPAVDLKSSKDAVALANKHDNVYACVGFHPLDIESYTDESLKEIEKLLSENKVVAIGEIGLDYYYSKDNKERQKEIFIKQLELSRKHNLPVVIHSRDASGDTFDILKNYSDLKVQLHCYSGSVELMREYVKLGFLISVGGVLTYKNSQKIKDVVAEIPIENLMLETDSPYLSPQNFRGLRNDPRKIIETLHAVSQIRSDDMDKLAGKIYKNTKRFFAL